MNLSTVSMMHTADRKPKQCLQNNAGLMGLAGPVSISAVLLLLCCHRAGNIMLGHSAG